MAKTKIVKTSNNTGYRLGDKEENLVVIEGVKLIKRKSNNPKAIQLKEIQFGCFDETTISRFNNIKVDFTPLMVGHSYFIFSAISHVVKTLFSRDTIQDKKG